MPKSSSYLSQLRFEPKLLNTIWAKYLANIRLPILIVISVIAIGVSAFVSIPRRLNPEVKIPIVIVSTSLPGASSEDVESLVTVPLEDAVANVKGLDTMTSTSSEGSSTIIMQFLSSVDKEKARTDVQSAVDTVNDLPSDARKTNVQALDFENQPIWTFVLTTKKDQASLLRFSKELQKSIEDLPKVDHVVTSGLPKQQIEIIVDQVKLNEFGLNPAILAQAIQKAANSYPLGNISTGNSVFTLTINKDIATVDDIRGIQMNINDQVVTLGEVATVFEKPLTDQPKSLLASQTEHPQPIVQFLVYKTSNANIDAAAADTVKLVDQKLRQYNGDFQIDNVLNTANEISKQFTDLFNEFLSTIAIIFLLLFLFLGLRQALISSITVPLTFLSAFAIINAFGLSLNFLTMFAFLLSLGLCIDDTIVVVAAMTRYYRTGKFTPYQTGVMVWRDFIVPLWSTTITTIWAFVPLLIASGIIGEFIKSIPIVVTATMLSSTTIAVLVTLPLMIVFLKPNFAPRVKAFLKVLGLLAFIAMLIFFLPKNIFLPIIVLLALLLIFIAFMVRQSLFDLYSRVTARYHLTRKASNRLHRAIDHGLFDIQPLSDRYRIVIGRILDSASARRGVLIAIAAFAIIAYMLIPLGLVKNEFFPKADADIIYINVELPAGTSVAKANQVLVNLMGSIRKNPYANYIVGESGQSFSAESGDRSNVSNQLLLTLHLPPKNQRHLSSIDISQKLREQYRNYSDGTLTVTELSGGPPAGADVQIKLLGDDLSTLDTIANKIAIYLQTKKGVTNIEKSIKPGTSRLVFVPQKDKLAENGLTVDAIALWIRTYATGFTLDTVKISADKQDVILRTSDATQSPEAIGSINIPTSKGSVPLISLGTFKLEKNPTVISREDRKRTLSVSASTTAGYSAVEQNKELLDYVKTLDFPPGYTWATGGVNEENAKSVQSIFQAMIISMLLILITMVIEFQSFRQTAIALLIIPISIAGVFYIFALTATPLSFPALIGVLALFGIVITHVIVVMEKINENRRHGMELKPAIVDAAANRLEPVLLTSLATIAGLVPVTIADPLWRGLGGAIISGLLFSGAIKLFFVPVMYYFWFKDKKDKI